MLTDIQHYINLMCNYIYSLLLLVKGSYWIDFKVDLFDDKRYVAFLCKLYLKADKKKKNPLV